VDALQELTVSQMEALQKLRHSNGNLHHDTLKEIRTFA